MDNELGNDTPLTDEQIAANSAAEQAAFVAEFARDDVPALDGLPETPARAAAPAPAPAAAPAPAPAPANDPFADVPAAMRELLADIPSLKNDLKRTDGRVASLQRENEALKHRLAQAPAAPAPAAVEVPIEGEDAVKGELPEVVRYVRNALKQMKPAEAPAPEAAPAAPAPAPVSSNDDSDPEELNALNEFDPQWGTKMHSADFKLFLAMQDRTQPGFSERVMSTTKSGVVITALSKFNAHQAAAQSAADAAQRKIGQRHDRAAAAVQPRGSRAAAPAPNDDANAAFLAGFSEG